MRLTHPGDYPMTQTSTPVIEFNDAGTFCAAPALTYDKTSGDIWLHGIVRIRSDGTVSFEHGVTPTLAAAVFWQEVSKLIHSVGSYDAPNA